jgi:hypothetical protein
MPFHHLQRKKAKTSLNASSFADRLKRIAEKGEKMARRVAESDILPSKYKKVLGSALDLLPLAQDVMKTALSDSKPDEARDGQLKSFGFLLPAIASAIGGLLNASGTNQEIATMVPEELYDESVSDSGSDDDVDSACIYYTCIGSGDSDYPVMRRVNAKCVARVGDQHFLRDDKGAITSKLVLKS